MITVALIHGMRVDLPPDWWIDWVSALRSAGLKPDVSVAPIEWEAPCRRGWLPDLLGDLTAVMAHHVLRDVKMHLDRQSWLSDGLIVIAHSLGTVLAHQALMDTELDCRLLVTMGSPLWWIDYPCSRYRVEKPRGVRRWVNFYSFFDWFIGRRPLAGADLNIRCTWSTHAAMRYLRSAPFRRVMPELFADWGGI